MLVGGLGVMGNDVFCLYFPCPFLAGSDFYPLYAITDFTRKLLLKHKPCCEHILLDTLGV